MMSRLASTIKHALLASGIYRKRLQRDRFPGVAVLCYHGVLADSADSDGIPFERLHVRASELEAHCRFVREVCHPISIRKWIASVDGDEELPERPVLFTFDDGYRNVFTRAKPILEKFEIPALIFVASGAVQNEELFWHDRVASECGTVQVEDAKSLPYSRWFPWQKAIRGADIAELKALKPGDVKALAQHPLFDVGGHTVSHLLLSRADGPTQRQEITQNRLELLDWTQVNVRAFAYPNGRPGTDYTEETVRLVREASYRMAFSTRPAFAISTDSPWELPRFLMLSGISAAELAHRLTFSWRRP